MIEDNNEYLFTLDNESIRKMAGIELTDDECEDVANELDYMFDCVVADIARKYRIAHPAKHCSPTVMAEVTLQVWNRDYACDVKTVQFDCSLALDEFSLSDLPEDGDFSDGACNCGDDVFFESVHKALVDDWDGPFHLCICDEDEWLNYMNDRMRREH